MSLEFRKTSRWWYGVFTVNGERQVVNLGVKIAGQRPAKRTQQGDDVFERSRGRALAAYELRQKELEDDRTEGRILERLVEIKTGAQVNFPKLADLPDLWAGIPRRKEPNPKHVAHCRTVMRRFADFAATHQEGVTEFVAVKPETAAAFMAAEEARGLTPKTWNDTLKLLRSTFQHLHPDLPAGKNPLRGLITKASETVSRQPFSVEELKAIQDACQQDRLIGPVVLTGMCTAMRLGDCCRLRWPDVDLKEGFITVKTSKTGERVDIPILPLLREELERTPRRGKQEFCFREQADIYDRDTSGMSKRVQKFLAKALDPQPEPDLPELPPADLRQRSLAYLDTRPPEEKTDKMRQVIDLYLQGANIDAVTEAAGCSKSTVSLYLNELEEALGVMVVRGKVRNLATPAAPENTGDGRRRISTRGFHSFRVTWITLALAAGVPLELVQRVTGHRTTEVVMKHYFRPGREDFRAAIFKAMPKMLADGRQKSFKEQMREILERMTPRTCKQDKAQLLDLLASL